MDKITIQKEVEDSRRLAEKIREDGWMDSDTLIVNCSPDYSSICCQVINHSLSSGNRHELYEQLSLEMPYPTMSQIFNRDTGEWELFSKYLPLWVSRQDKKAKYLFIDSATVRGKNFSLLKSACLNRLNYKLASLYVEESSLLIPDYYVERYSQKDGGLIFEWENPLNPNWNY